MAIINGTNGNDTLKGTSPTGDIINGFQGNDLIEAGPGNDIINAGDGVNVLVAGTGADLIFAGSGRNSFFQGPGSALFSAGSGMDQFYFGPVTSSTPEGGGKVWIAGFHSGDIMNMNSFPDIQSFADLQRYVTISGNNSVIDVSSEIGKPSGSEVITVLNNTQLQPQDFIFRSSLSFATDTAAVQSDDNSGVMAHLLPLDQLIPLEATSHIL